MAARTASMHSASLPCLSSSRARSSALLASLGESVLGAAPDVPCWAAGGWPSVWRRTSSGDVALPSVCCRMMLVGGCWADELAADGVPLAAPAVGPEPASLAARILERLSISLPQGPEVAELTPSAKSIILARMNAIVFIACSFRNRTHMGRLDAVSMWRGFLCNPAPDAVFHAKWGQSDAPQRRTPLGGAITARRDFECAGQRSVAPFRYW